MKRDHAWLESYTEMLIGKAVLELGCGPGIDSKVISEFSDFLVSGDLAPVSYTHLTLPTILLV